MIQKGTQLNVADKCHIWTVNLFHIYRGFRHKQAKFGDFLRVSIRRTKATSWLKKGKKTKAIFVRSVFKRKKIDGSYVKLKNNVAVLLKKRLNSRGKEIEGPVFFGLKRKKFVSSFAGII